MADGGGQIAHDIGSTKFTLGAGNPTGLGYSGPTATGGSTFTEQAQFASASGSVGSQTSPFSVELWYWQIPNPSINQWLFTWDGMGSPSGFEIVANSNLTVQFSLNGGTALSVATFGTQLWHYVVCTYAAPTMTLYVDAISRATGTVSGPITLNRAIGVGGLIGSTANSFLGMIGEVAMYTTALTPTQVNNHFLAAENTTGDPVFGAAGGTGSGGSPGAPFLTILQQILARVSTIYVNTP
jgi:hypothetical protein